MPQAPRFIEEAIDPVLLPYLTSIYELKGKLALYRAEIPHVLQDLSRRMPDDNVVATNTLDRVATQRHTRELLDGTVAPEDPQDHELLDYRALLRGLFERPTKQRSLSARAEELYRTLSRAERPAEIAERLERYAHQDAFDRFLHVVGGATRGTLTDLDHLGAEAIDAPSQREPLLAIGADLFTLLRVRPFPDFNGRVARLLTMERLDRAGFDVVRYYSLDQRFEAQAELFQGAFLETLRAPRAAPGRPWLEQFLRAVHRAYTDLDSLLSLRLEDAQREQVRRVILQLPETFTVPDIERFAPGVSRTTLNRVLGAMRRKGEIVKVPGKGTALWQRLYRPQ